MSAKADEEETLTTWSAEDIRAELRERYQPYTGAIENLARDLGMTPKYLGSMMRGEREPNAKVLAHFGLERRVLYVEVGHAVAPEKSPYGALATRLRELEVGETFVESPSRQRALHAQAGRIGIKLRTTKLDCGDLLVARVS